MILSSILIVAALVVLVRLLFGAAVYALPVTAGLGAAMLAHRSGAGLIGAALVGLAAGAIILATGQALLASLHTPISRVLVVAVFTTPAAVVGFAMTYGALVPIIATDFWRVTISLGVALFVAQIAFQRISVVAPPREQSGTERRHQMRAHDVPSQLP